jgi:predicted  nucleic acid-binding Zn-ribbon protein
MQKETAKLDIKRVEEEQKQLALRREKTTKNAAYVEMNIGDLRADYSSIAEIVTSKLGAFSPDREIAKIGEFSLRFPHTQSEKKQFLVFDRLNTEYYVEIGDSLSGNKTRLSNFFEKFKNQVSNLEKRYDELEEKKENLKNQIQYCSGIEKKIERLEEEKQALFDKLSIKNVD